MPKSVEELFPEDRFVFLNRVAVFRTHNRVKNGKRIEVTRDDLQEIANNHNSLFSRLGVAAPFSEGHTLDGEVLEKDQPDVCGYAFRFFVDREPEDPDNYYLYCTWALPKDKLHIPYDYPSRSPEYYPSRKQLFPISVLKSNAPELELPPVRYDKELKPGEEEPYRLLLTTPINYSQTPTTEFNSMEKCDPKDKKMEYAKDDMPADKPKEEAVEKATDAERKGAKTDNADMNELKQMVSQLLPLLQMLPDLQALVSLMKDEEPAGDDLMKPADAPKPTDTPSPDEGKGIDKPADREIDQRKDTEAPVKFDGAMGSSTNANIPSFTKKKEDYTVNNEELVKYKKEVETEVAKYKAELDATKKVANDLLKKSRQAEAKAMVSRLETEFMIQYASDKERTEDIQMFSELEPKSAEVMFDRCKVRYQKKLPDHTTVKDVAKYAVEGEPDLNAKTPEEAWERAQKIIQSGKTREQWYADLAKGTTKQ